MKQQNYSQIYFMEDSPKYSRTVLQSPCVTFGVSPDFL
jgi:hypothetical protein